MVLPHTHYISGLIIGTFVLSVVSAQASFSKSAGNAIPPDSGREITQQWHTFYFLDGGT